MKEETFENIGKIKAIEQLYEIYPIKGESSTIHKTRLFLEDIDFDLFYFPLKHLGYKCVTAITGELYSDLAKPESLNVVIGASAKLDYPQIKELWEGICFAAEEHKYKNINLDIQPASKGISIALSSTGSIIEGYSQNKPQCQSKDVICISDNIGGAYFGMLLLEKYKENPNNDLLEKHKMMIGSYLRPKINPDIIKYLEEDKIYPSSAFLVSKGLADTVKRLAKKSNLGVKIYADKIPFEGNSFDLGKDLDVDPISAAMNGGDDYKLLFTIPILEFERFRETFKTFDIIGHLAQKEVEEVLVTPEGVELPIKAQGWE